MTLTTDPNDPRLGHGVDDPNIPVSQHEVYLVLSEEERSKGFVRPVRMVYTHVGAPGPTYPLRDLTPDEHARYDQYGYIQFEAYTQDGRYTNGRYWTQARLDRIGKGCGTETRMGRDIAETYARNNRFYGATYCVMCHGHYPVGEDGEFVWAGTAERVGS